MKLSQINILKVILFLALINSSLFIIYKPSGFSFLRIFTAISIFLSGSLLLFLFLNSGFKKWKISYYFKGVYSLLLIWSLFIILRSVSTNSKELITLFFHYLMAWAWLTPLAIIFGFKIKNWIKIIDFLSKMLLIGILFTFISTLFFKGKFGFGVVEWLQFYPILLFTFFYHNKTIKKITIIATLAFAVISIYNSQRINALFFIMSLFFFIVEYLKQKRINFLKKGLILSFVGFIIISSFIYWVKNEDRFMSDESLTTDTRTFLFLELFSDMSPTEVIIGKGALGSYYSPYFNSTEGTDFGADSSTRMSVEVGYLEMILKGGVIMMILQLLVLIPAAFLGIFKSNNVIGRMSGYIIFMYIVSYTISYYPIYSAEYILLWMAVGSATSSKVRNLYDRDLIVIRKIVNVK